MMLKFFNEKENRAATTAEVKEMTKGTPDKANLKEWCKLRGFTFTIIDET